MGQSQPTEDLLQNRWICVHMKMHSVFILESFAFGGHRILAEHMFVSQLSNHCAVVQNTLWHVEFFSDYLDLIQVSSQVLWLSNCFSNHTLQLSSASKSLCYGLDLQHFPNSGPDRFPEMFFSSLVSNLIILYGRQLEVPCVYRPRENSS